jgi:hypothetical protein
METIDFCSFAVVQKNQMTCVKFIFSYTLCAQQTEEFSYRAGIVKSTPAQVF